jgi:predicted nucleic acid-binding protein
MFGDQEALVFDTGPLSHFARCGWLGPLKAVVGDRLALMPDAVRDELERGARTDSRLQAVLDADWIETRELLTAEELRSYGRFESRLVSGQRNRGEAAVLALAETLPAVAVIDDGAGRRAASDFGVQLRPTLKLVCEAIRSGLLTIELASALVDDLLETEYRLPLPPGGPHSLVYSTPPSVIRLLSRMRSTSSGDRPLDSLTTSRSGRSSASARLASSALRS